MSREVCALQSCRTGGVSLKSLLQRSDPWPVERCGRGDCFPCKREKGGDCRRSGVTYRIVCLECNAEYKGESSRNLYSRGKEHLQDYNNKSEKSALWAHCETCHDSRRVEFAMQQTGSFTSALARQVTEAVQIYNFDGESFNRKSEFRKPAVARTVFTRELEDQ